MKIKNLILGGTAFVLALGAAIASVMVNPVYIQRVVGNPATSNYRIINQNLCSVAGNADCMIAVIIADTATTRLVYPSAGATTPLRCSTDYPDPIPPVSFP